MEAACGKHIHTAIHIRPTPFEYRRNLFSYAEDLPVSDIPPERLPPAVVGTFKAPAPRGVA